MNESNVLYRERKTTAKKSKAMYIIGAAIIAVAIFLIVFMVFLVSDVTNARPRLVLTSMNAEKVYDGTPLLEDKVIQSGELKKGHEYLIAPGDGRVDVGKTPNYFSVRILNKSGKDVTGEYDIDCQYGELQVIPRHIFIKSADASKAYDGNPLKSDAYEILTGKILDTHTLTATVYGERTDAGASNNEFVAAITDGAGKDVTHNYQIDRVYGYLQVFARKITVTAGSAEKPYDGTALTCLTYTLSSGSAGSALVAGDTIAVTLAGAQTERGRSSNEVRSVKIVDAIGKDVTDNYAVAYVSGELSVTN